MSEEKFCPGCGRHCDLENPHCGWGEEYRRTGEMPERKCEGEHSGRCRGEEGHHHGEGYRRGEEGHHHGEGCCRGEEGHHHGEGCRRGEEGHHHGEGCHHGEGHHHEEGCRREARMQHYQAADENEKLIINLRDLGHMMRFQYEGKASQRRILIILEEEGKVTQRDLTERLGIQPGSASEILAKLESAGWISRTQNETDRRTTDVCLTDTGRQLAAEALTQRRKSHEEMFSCLSEKEKQELLSLLEKVCTDWRGRYRGGRCAHHDGHGCRQHGHGRN